MSGLRTTPSRMSIAGGQFDRHPTPGLTSDPDGEESGDTLTMVAVGRDGSQSQTGDVDGVGPQLPQRPVAAR